MSVAFAVMNRDVAIECREGKKTSTSTVHEAARAHCCACAGVDVYTFIDEHTHRGIFFTSLFYRGSSIGAKQPHPV